MFHDNSIKGDRRLGYMLKLTCPCHKLKKCAVRIILDAAPDVPSQSLFNELNWLNIYERIEYSHV